MHWGSTTESVCSSSSAHFVDQLACHLAQSRSMSLAVTYKASFALAEGDNMLVELVAERRRQLSKCGKLLSVDPCDLQQVRRFSYNLGRNTYELRRVQSKSTHLAVLANAPVIPMGCNGSSWQVWAQCVAWHNLLGRGIRPKAGVNQD